jgi:hypothetical protein
MCSSAGIRMVLIFVLGVAKHVQHYTMQWVALVFILIISHDCSHFTAHCYSSLP